MIPPVLIDFLCTAYLLCSTLFLAGKDADSYQLKDKQDNNLSNRRVRRWHRDGMALAFLFVVPCCILGTWYWALISALLVRLSIFDLLFNEWSGLPVTYLGGTAGTDKLFVKIFGIHGALLKSGIFFLLLIAEHVLICIL